MEGGKRRRRHGGTGSVDGRHQVGRTLGKGTFGLAYEAFTTSNGQKKLKGRRDAEGRVVIKRCLDDDQADIEAYFNRRSKLTPTSSIISVLVTSVSLLSRLASFRVRRLGKQAYFATFLGAQRRAGATKGMEGSC
eukprot:759151-Hanusia_phi.AAC.2